MSLQNKVIELHAEQKKVALDDKRFKVLRAGRRGGKTESFIEEIKVALFRKTTINMYIANTQEQAINLIWLPLKRQIPEKYFRESSPMSLIVPNQEGGESILYIGSWEKREKHRGMSFDNLFFDEIDTMKNFVRDFEDIYRPTLADRLGRASFAGTPKVTRPNLKRLETQHAKDEDWGFYRFTAYDNPVISKKEIENARETLSKESFAQEWLAEYNDENLAIFRMDAVSDLRTNNLVEDDKYYLTYDPSGKGKDFNIFVVWKGWEMIKVIKKQNMVYEDKIQQIKTLQAQYKIPMSRTLVDGVGVGEDLGNSRALEGIVVFKSSYGAFKTSKDITSLDAKGIVRSDKMVSDYADLRSQCVFYLAKKVNNHEVKISFEDREIINQLEEELLVLTETEHSKIKVISKDEIKTILQRSTDISDNAIMRSYFDIREDLVKVKENPIENARVFGIMDEMYDNSEGVNNL